MSLPWPLRLVPYLCSAFGGLQVALIALPPFRPHPLLMLACGLAWLGAGIGMSRRLRHRQERSR